MGLQPTYSLPEILFVITVVTNSTEMKIRMSMHSHKIERLWRLPYVLRAQV